MSAGSDAYIVDAIRSPLVRGRKDGQFSQLHPVSLFGQVIASLVERTGVDGASIDDVIGGCVTQIGEQSNNVTRNAVLAAGLPESVPGTTVDRQCGSSQQAAAFAAYGVQAGAYDLVIAGGVETMSTVPMFSNKDGRDAYGPDVDARYGAPLIPQGISAELVAARWKISREDMDAYAVRSHVTAAQSRADGLYARQIVPITSLDADGGKFVVTEDDGIRPDSNVEKLATLRAAFVDADYEARFPEISWSVTAGNASQISDGSSAMLIASEKAVADLGLRPRARILASTAIGDDPIMMLTAIIPATQRALARAGLSIDDIDAFEVNEAFASVVLAWLAETGADPAKVNAHGGSIALGHPLGASGTRLMTNLLTGLEATGGRYGLQTMCEAGGMANATIIERLD